ncbi:MAG: pyridoxal phosphate-dependent aminotransferase [Chloroflexaceae bacterium]
MTSTIQQSSPRLSKRLARLQPSATVGLGNQIAQLRAQGISIISFGQGEPDFPTPAPIKAAAIAAIETNQTRYTPTGGIMDLRRAIAARVTQHTGINYTPNQISVTTGAKEAIFLAFQSLCDEGEEVIVPAPYWVSYVEQVRLAGAVPVVIDTDESTGFKITAEQLQAHLSPRTRALILNTPSNPTGTVYTEEELAALAGVLRGTPVVVISDEIYDAICYVDYARWLRVAPDFADRTLVINGASKTYAMTGWRIGYVAGPEGIVGPIRSIQSHSTTHPASIAQHAALAAFTPSEELAQIVAGMVQAFHERRDLIIAALQEIAGVTCMVPDGAFYVFPNVSSLLNRPLKEGAVCATASDLAEYLLDQARIGVVPGEAFGAPGYLRLSYAQSNADIAEGMRRFAEAVAG